MTFTINFDDNERPITNGRHCGGCTLCCKLLPVRELDKGANTKCDHQKFGKGCSIYRSPRLPWSCKLWSCRWLTDTAAADLHRPDRTHYVIDIMPDYVRAVDHATGREQRIEVIVVWCDPKYPDAHRDPALRRYLETFDEGRGAMALIRYNSIDAITLLPPSFTDAGVWIEHHDTSNVEQEHSIESRMMYVEPIFKERTNGRQPRLLDDQDR